MGPANLRGNLLRLFRTGAILHQGASVGILFRVYVECFLAIVASFVQQLVPHFPSPRLISCGT